MRGTVSLVRAQGLDGSGIREAAHRALDMLGLKPPEQARRIVIKPNLCYYWDYSTGETTDPRLVSSLIDYVRERWNKETEITIIESDASAMRAKHAFRMLGYEELAEKKSVRLVNLSEDEVSKKEVNVGQHKLVLPLPRVLLESDFLINVPKLKVGPYAGGKCLHLTCALKNLFGCISEPKKIKFHPHLQEAIVGVNKVIKPGLTVVDGVVALGKHPVRLGLIIAGTDNLAVDFVAAKAMGYNPWRINYLSLAAREGVGDVENVRVIGENIKDVCRFFPKRSRLGFKVSWSIQLSLLHAYTKVSGDIVPAVLEKT